MDMLARQAFLSKRFLLLKVPTLKSTCRENACLSDETLFPKWLCLQKSKQEVMEIISLCKKWQRFHFS